jgi:uncharacterized integral membrane protein
MAVGPGRAAVTPTRVLWLVLAVLAIILVAQNSDDTQIRVLGWTIQAPLFVVIVAAMVIGWGLGTLGVQAWSLRRRRSGGGEKRADADNG